MIQSHLNFLRTKGGSEPTQQTHLAMIGYFCDTTLTSQKSQQMHDQWSHLVLSELLLISHIKAELSFLKRNIVVNQCLNHNYSVPIILKLRQYGMLCCYSFIHVH